MNSNVSASMSVKRPKLVGNLTNQWSYAKLDMMLSLEPQPVIPLWKKLEHESPLGHLEGTYKPANFQHIASGGYASGYYGYMWSEVIALDMLSKFQPGHMLDPKVGTRYRDRRSGRR